MKKIYYISVFLILVFGANAQISINTERTWGVFMIDGAGDDSTTGTPTPSQEENNFFVNSDGRVGIGAQPSSTGTASLLVNGTITMQDGNQGLDKVLMTDANGKASWQMAPGLPFVKGFIHNTGLASGLVPDLANTKYNTGCYIDLHRGKYAVSLILFATTSNNAVWPVGMNAMWMTTTLSDSPTVLANSPDFIGGYLFSGTFPPGTLYAIIKGSLVIKNKTATTKRYYLIINGFSRPGGNSTPTVKFPNREDNKFYAIRLGDE